MFALVQHSYVLRMTQIRLSVGALRAALAGLNTITEVEDKKAKEFYAKRQEKYDEKQRDDSNVAKVSAPGFTTARVYEPSAEQDELEPPPPLTPEEFKDPNAIAAHEEALKAYRAARKVQIEKNKGSVPKPAPAASIKTGGKPIKQPPSSRPVTKDYVGPTKTAPYLTTQNLKSRNLADKNDLDVPETTLDREQLKKISLKAFQNVPPGDWKEFAMRAGYIIAKPKDPKQKPLIWASVPPKGGEPAKPHAWRSIEELAGDQKTRLGYFDKRTLGSPSTDVETKHDKNPEHRKDADALRVKFKGDPMGRVDIETTGTMPGSVSGQGGTPTKDARAAVAAADKAAQAVIPDWNTLPLDKLTKAAEMAERRFKSSKDPEEMQILKDINDALVSRESGEPPAKPIKLSLPRKLQRNDVRDVIRAFEADDYERAAAYLGTLPFSIRVSVEGLLSVAYDKQRLSKLIK